MDEFPGSQPVSLSEENLRLLQKEPYMVSWKADGTRYLLLIQKDGGYLLDRDFRIYHLKHIYFPRKDLGGMLTDTLIDGELVIDTTTDEKGVKTKRPRFLMYDLVRLNNAKAPLDYAERLNLLKVRYFPPFPWFESPSETDFFCCVDRSL